MSSLYVYPCDSGEDHTDCRRLLTPYGVTLTRTPSGSTVSLVGKSDHHTINKAMTESAVPTNPNDRILRRLRLSSEKRSTLYYQQAHLYILYLKGSTVYEHVLIVRFSNQYSELNFVNYIVPSPCHMK